MFYQPPSHADAADWSDEFQERRRETWQKSRFAFALLALGVATMWIPRVEIFGAGAFAVAIVWLTYVCQRYYRCPSCDSIPMSGYTSMGSGGVSFSRGVALNPEFCSTCGVRLRSKFRATSG